MGKRIGADGRGRYEEKGGGQQVGSFFAEATDNEKIKAIYGNYGFWSWLRYWWIDTENYTSFMLMDKGFYDYDYSEPKGGVAKGRNITKATDPEKLKAKLARLGITQQPSAPLTPAELQAEVMREEEKKRAAL